MENDSSGEKKSPRKLSKCYEDLTLPKYRSNIST
jgi:hypothetical protein